MLWQFSVVAVTKSIRALNHKGTKAQRKRFLFAGRCSGKRRKNFAVKENYHGGTETRRREKSFSSVSLCLRG